MRVENLAPGEEFRVQVDELSALATSGQYASTEGELLAVGDEAAELFRLRIGGDGPDRNPRGLPMPYVAPPKSGSNFEGIAADDHGNIVVVTEFPAGLVIVRMSSLVNESHFVAHTRLLFDEDSMRRRADMHRKARVQPEGTVLMRDGHLLLAQEKEPVGLFELGPPDDKPLGVQPSSFLSSGSAFDPPPQLAALAWWPVPDSIEDVSDLAVWNGRLHLLSDQSKRIARLASGNLHEGDEVEFDMAWTFPHYMKNTEGLIFLEDGRFYVGLDVKLEAEPDGKNFVLFPGLPD